MTSTHDCIERRPVVQERSVDGVLLPKLFAQQFPAFVIELLGSGVMAEVGLQKRVSNQARRIRRMVDPRLPAQDIQAFFEKLFRFRVLAYALIRACEVDAKRTVLFA